MRDRYYGQERTVGRTIRSAAAAAAMVGILAIGGGIASGKLDELISPRNVVATVVPSPTTTAEATPIPDNTLPPTKAPPKSEEELPNLQSIGQSHYGDIVVYYDKNHSPIKYTKNGKEYDLSQKVEEAKARQAISGEPEVVTQIETIKPAVNRVRPDQNFVPSQEKPLIVEAPRVLNKEELALRGITIVNSSKATLGLTQEAFGDMLDQFGPGSDKKMVIVLLDGPAVADKYLTTEEQQQFKPVLENYAAGEYENFRQIKIMEFQKMIDEERLSPTPSNDIILYGKLGIGEWKRYSIEQLAALNRITKVAAAGSFIPEYWTQKLMGEQYANTSLVFLAVGDDPSLDTGMVNIILNTDGKVEANWAGGILSPYRTPSLVDTYPDITQEPQAGNWIGHTLRHELGHFRGIEGKDQLKLTGELTGFTAPDPSEETANRLAAESYQRSWQTWRSSNFSDSSGFWGVLKYLEPGTDEERIIVF